ncbi:MAG: hypothetical protein OSB15_10355 [Amylibacter sp.]|jgi:hypothetical protein|nr:hypothetical protein [Amylibacter sp.]
MYSWVNYEKHSILAALLDGLYRWTVAIAMVASDELKAFKALNKAVFNKEEFEQIK